MPTPILTSSVVALFTVCAGVSIAGNDDVANVNALANVTSRAPVVRRVERTNVPSPSPTPSSATVAGGNSTRLLATGSIADSYRSGEACPVGGRCGQPRCRTCKRVGSRISDFWDQLTCEHRGDPSLFCERPFGLTIRSQFDAHIANGFAAQLVLYHYDFYPDSSPMAGKLTARGRRQLRELAHILRSYPSPLTVETTGNRDMDAVRKRDVIEQLSMLDYQIAPDQVQVRTPDRRGLDALEAMMIQANLLQQTSSMGGGLGGGSGGAGIVIPSLGQGVQ